MPFTPSHAAAVLPFMRLSWLVPSALVIGSVVPDLPYFMELGVQSASTHTLWAVIWFAVPMGMFVYFVFHWLIASALVILLPLSVRSRMNREEGYSFARIDKVAASVGLGALTHVVWDSFTHEGAFVVSHVAILQADVFTVGGYTFCGYKILQHLSSIAGLAIVGIWIMRWYMRTPTDPEFVRAESAGLRWWGYALVFVVPALIAFMALTPDEFSGPWLATIRNSVSEAVFAAGESFVMFSLAFALFAKCYSLFPWAETKNS